MAIPTAYADLIPAPDVTPGRPGRFGLNVHFRAIMAMPPENCLWRHDGRDLPEYPSTESPALCREAAALVVRQPKAAPLQLLLEDPVLFCQVLDDVLLVALTHPARVTSSTCKG